MPTIDTSTIEGFDTMSAEDKVAALLKLDVPEKVDLSGYVPKATADKYASEAADFKKQLQAKMSDEERSSKEAEEAQKKLQDEYNALLKKSTIADHTANFLALGYDKDLARSTAEALFDGDMDKVFENQKKFNEAREKQLRAELVKKDPRPDGAGGGSDDKSAGEKIAERIGKNRAEAATSANEILKHFTGGV